MPVEVDWYDKDQKVIYSKYSGTWTIAEAAVGIDKFNELARQVEGRFDLIADLSQAAFTPPVGFLWEWAQAVERRSLTFPDWGLTALVLKSSVYQAYFEEVSKLSEAVRKRTRLAQNHKDAMDIIIADRENGEV